MARILIADDSATATTLMQQALAPLCHIIETACDGEEAKNRLDEDPPDLVILDVVMPKINGFELCRAIREDPRYQQLPIIVVSAMDSQSDRYWGLKQGANEYLTKPFSPEELQETVGRYL